MRRVIGVALVGLGVFMVAAALLLRFYAAPQLLKAPLDQFSETVAVAEDATYLDVSALEVREGRTLQATRTVRGDVPAGDDTRAVYDVFVKIIDPRKPGSGEEQLVSASTDRVAFDRRTSEAINCCDENVDGEPVEHEGIEYKFPFDAQKETYQYFDTSIREATEMEFVEEEELEGLTVYRYQQVVTPTRIAEIDVPGDLVGEPDPTVTLGRFYSVVRTVWVEPTTGVIVKGSEDQFSTLRDATGRDRLTITDAELVFSDETVQAQAEVAKDTIGQARLITGTGPLVLGLLGIALVIGGLLLARGGRPNPGRRVAVEREPEYV